MTDSLLIDHPAVSGLLFYPNGYSFADPVVVPCDGAELACHYHEVDPGACTVVFFHGNGESVGDYAEMLPRVFALVGCNTFLAECRGYGGSTGTPTLSTLFPDCEQILKAVPGPTDRMIFFGRSMGCIQAAAAAGVAPDCRGLILESGVDDVYPLVVRYLTRERNNPYTALRYDLNQDHFGVLRGEVDAHCNVAAALARYRGCATVTYSGIDEMFRRVSSHQLYDNLLGPKRLIKFDNADHSGVLKANLKTYCEQIRDMTSGAFRGDHSD